MLYAKRKAQTESGSPHSYEEGISMQQKHLLASIVCSLLVLAAIPAAAVPDEMSYQAYLTNDDGSPVNMTISITFAAYTVDFGGTPLWSQTIAVPVDQGLLSVTLGGPPAPFPVGLFNTDIYIGLFVAGEEMLPRRKLISTPFSFKSGDAETVGGMSAASLDQSGDVAALQGDVSGLDSRILTLEATDITSVSGVNGLNGSGSSGSVNIGIAPGGVTNSRLAPNSVASANIIDNQVGSADIQNGGVTLADMGVNSVGSPQILSNAVGASEISAGAVGSSEVANNSLGAVDLAANSVGASELVESERYTIESLLIDGSMTNIVDSQGDWRFHDSINGFRWYDTAGTTQQGYIIVSSSTNEWVDANQGSRRVFHSDAGGIGIGTTATSTGYDVSMPSLSVSGQTSVGLTRVTSTFQLTSMSSNCHSHGNLTCYYGSGSVTCPVGTRVLGGGTSGHSALFGSMSISYPSSNTAWNCALSYDLANVTRTCYAVCARLE